MTAVTFDEAFKQKPAYKFWVRELVRFTDLDALGHVSAVRTNEYFNTARASLFKQAIPNWPRADQLPVLKLSILSHEKEMHFPADVDVGITIEKWGKSSLVTVMGVFSPDCVALSRNVLVFIDAKTRAPVTPHDAIKQNLTKLAG